MNEHVKVYAYITHGTRLLVFIERGFSEGGIQVPGGSPEEDELPEDAVVREAMEETGLRSLQLVRYLGESLFDLSVYDLNEIHRRKFYHLLCNETPRESRSHEELDPSIRMEDTPEHIVFDIFWWNLKDGIPDLQLGFEPKLSV